MLELFSAGAGLDLQSVLQGLLVMFMAVIGYGVLSLIKTVKSLTETVNTMIEANKAQEENWNKTTSQIIEAGKETGRLNNHIITEQMSIIRDTAGAIAILTKTVESVNQSVFKLATQIDLLDSKIKNIRKEESTK